MKEIDPVSLLEFEQLQLALVPDASDSLLRVPWHISLTRALSAARQENKPLAMIVRSGHPLGCTCNNGLVERVSILGDPEITTLLATRFVTVAIDQHIHRRLTDSEGELFTDLVRRAGQVLDVTAQGFYVFTGSKELLEFTHAQIPTIVKQVLTSALAKMQSFPSTAERDEPDLRGNFAPRPPAGAIVLDVISKVLGGYREPETERERILQSSLGRDHCWVLDEEAANLSRGKVDDTLLRRMARFHLVDNTRGEPPKWRDHQIRIAEAKLCDGRLAGMVQIASARGQRGYAASLLGFVESDNGMITRFDVVARGVAWGRGFHNAGAPRGQYPLAIRFALAKREWPFDVIPPGAARTRMTEYLGGPAMASR